MRDLADELLQAKVRSRLFGGDHVVTLGRLVILDRIGAGGMGAVYAAYDPRLDRRVAVKVLHAADADANARSLREARALAKLAHPNVIAIHDAGEDDGAVYIVMELVDGTPLRAWMREQRTWRDVVRVMRDAAHGLAAAHRAGVVHRDIKPDNIVVGEDATRVVDFGLAVAEAHDDDLGGTPRYMAPEALDGAATAASDQYSFGKTLEEALGDREAPSWLSAIVKRTLAGDPKQRYVTMDAVAAALSRDRRRARVIAGVAVTALVVGAAGGALAMREDPIDRCAPPRGPAASENPALAAIASEWRASYRAVCEAKQPDRLLELRTRCLDRAIDRYDALVGVLGGPLEPAERAEATSAIKQLPDPRACRTLADAGELALPTDPAQRQRAIEAERALDRAWAEYALGRYRSARDRVVAVEAATQDLDAPGVHATRAVLAATIEARIGEPSVARAKLDTALAAAARAHAHELEHVVWTRLLRHELFAGKPARVLEWEQFARAAAARAGLDGAEIDGIVGEALRDEGRLVHARERLTRARESRDPLRPDQRAIIEMNLGSVELAMGQSFLAREAFERALVLAKQQLGDGHPTLAIYRDKLAEADRARGRIAAALAHHDASVALRTEIYGDADRSVATALLHRAETLLEAGQLARARADLEAARAIRVKQFGEASPRLGEIDAMLGDLEAARGRRSEALALYARAAALDPRLDLAARRAGLGELPSAEPAIEPFTIERALLVTRHAASLPLPARRERALAIASTLQAARTDDPALAIAVADLHDAANDRELAATLYRDALAALADEPSRLRLRALRGLAKGGDLAAATAADALAKQLPELAP